LKNPFDCFAKQNITRVTAELVNAQGVWNSQFVSNYYNALEAGIPEFHAIVRVNDSFVPLELCQNISYNLPENFNGTTWLYMNKTNWNRGSSQSLPYLLNLTWTCQAYLWNTGIYSDAKDWTEIMGDRTKGQSILRLLPLWYISGNKVIAFDDFDVAGFGGWTNPSMKEYVGKTYFCGTFVEGLEYYEKVLSITS